MKSDKFNKGDALCGYKLDSKIHQGERAEVWTAIQPSTGETVALKISHDADARQLADHAMEVASRLEGADLILVPLSSETVDGCVVTAMPLCNGRAVDAVAGAMTRETQLWRLICDIASALEALHGAGLVHRSVSPQNILWNDGHFYLSGLGSCQEAGGHNGSPTADSRFSPPEINDGKAMAPSDIWSLGATVFNLCMGTNVFFGRGGGAQKPQSPLPYMSNRLRQLSETVAQCLSYDPASRPTAAALRQIAQERIENLAAAKATRQRRVTSPARGHDQGDDFWSEAMI